MKTKASDVLGFVKEFDLTELYSKLPANEREWKTAIWLKHPLERLDDYRQFAENYLPLPPQYRSVKLAFHVHIFLNPRKVGLTWSEARTKNPTGNWYLTSKGQATFADASLNIHPKKQIVPYTWKQRASEFDKVRRRVQLDDFMVIRNQVVASEIEYAVDALDLFDKMFYQWRVQQLENGNLYLLPDEDEKAVARLTSTTKIETIKLKDIKELQSITQVRDEITRYARRALGLPSQIKEDVYSGDGEVEVKFINEYGLADATGNQHIYEDDITTEQLLKELQQIKTVEE